MKIARVRMGVLVTVTGLVLMGAGVTAAQATKPAPNHKVTLCHRTGSATGGNLHNGYTLITVDIASVANATNVRGHDNHNQIGNGPGGDIIPSYTYKTFTYPGKNVGNGGQAFLDNGCKKVERKTPTTPTKPTTPAKVTTTTSAVVPPAANPLPKAAAGGQADTSGQLLAGGLTGLAALLALGGGFMLRRRHGVE